MIGLSPKLSLIFAYLLLDGHNVKFRTYVGRNLNLSLNISLSIRIQHQCQKSRFLSQGPEDICFVRENMSWPRQLC